MDCLIIISDDDGDGRRTEEEKNDFIMKCIWMMNLLLLNGIMYEMG